jgi:lipopolysaccharide transport system permease protein
MIAPMPSSAAAPDRDAIDTAVAGATAGLQPAGSARLPPRAFAEMVVHLTRRNLVSTHHLTLLGWAWPLVRQLVQLGVLVFLFSSVFDLSIENFPVFVFSGLVAWTWFSGGLSSASTSVISQRHLVTQPRLPTAVLPMVAIAVPLVDALFALPVLILMLLFSTGIGPGVVLIVPLAVVQLAMMAGLAWLIGALSVIFRDVPNLISVGLGVLFYLTPVFYGLKSVPERFQWVLHLNPLTTLIEAYRAALLGVAGPSLAAVGALGAGSFAIAVIGYLAFQRLEPRFADLL